jgi:hypothetical protein
MQSNHSKRDKFHLAGLLIICAIVIASVFYAFFTYDKEHSSPVWAKIWFACGSLIPPIYFWFDWRIFGRSVSGDDKESRYVMHLHELGRNVWLAALGLLAIAYGFKLP